jgi:hypothetical protein
MIFGRSLQNNTQKPNVGECVIHAHSIRKAFEGQRKVQYNRVHNLTALLPALGIKTFQCALCEKLGEEIYHQADKQNRKGI